MSQPPSQEPLYPDSAPSSPYSSPQGPGAGGYGGSPSPYPPLAQPSPGYGSATPSPGYPPPSQPYPNYGLPLATPEFPPPSAPYQGNFPPSSYQPMPSQRALGAKRTNSRTVVALAIVGVLVLVGILHYGVFGPSSVVKSYIHDVLQYNGSAAYNLVCSDLHSTSLDYLYSTLSQGSNVVNFDDSGTDYATTNWGVSSATVHVGGSIAASSLGVSQTFSVNEDFPVVGSGLTWCIASSNRQTLGI